jgi:competence ComEA-like helix-hairpin-helix protein
MTRILRTLCVTAIAGGSVGAQDGSKNVLDRFPEGAGREDATSTCSACHTLSRVAANHRTKAQWAQTVKTHESRGLKLEPEEAAPIVQYLAAYFGPVVNLNTATEAEIADLPGVSTKMAASVVQFRNQHGPIKKVDDLDDVEGFSSPLLTKIKNRLSTGAEAGASKE